MWASSQPGRILLPGLQKLHWQCDEYGQETWIVAKTPWMFWIGFINVLCKVHQLLLSALRCKNKSWVTWILYGNLCFWKKNALSWPWNYIAASRTDPDHQPGQHTSGTWWVKTCRHFRRSLQQNIVKKSSTIKPSSQLAKELQCELVGPISKASDPWRWNLFAPSPSPDLRFRIATQSPNDGCGTLRMLGPRAKLRC